MIRIRRPKKCRILCPKKAEDHAWSVCPGEKLVHDQIEHDKDNPIPILDAVEKLLWLDQSCRLRTLSNIQIYTAYIHIYIYIHTVFVQYVYIFVQYIYSVVYIGSYMPTLKVVASTM